MSRQRLLLYIAINLLNMVAIAVSSYSLGNAWATLKSIETINALTELDERTLKRIDDGFDWR